jgi:hypothetical protein
LREADGGVGVSAGLDDDAVARPCRCQRPCELRGRSTLPGGGALLVEACRHDGAVWQDLRRDDPVANSGLETSAIASICTFDRDRSDPVENDDGPPDVALAADLVLLVGSRVDADAVVALPRQRRRRFRCDGGPQFAGRGLSCRGTSRHYR